MKINVWSKHAEVDETVRAQIERRLQFRFDRFSSRIMRVNVRITDCNGPRGGADKVCGIDIRLRQTGDIFVKDVNEDALVAADRASERAARAISRSIKRMQSFERESTAVQEQFTP
jgi:ribosome-associated translation inhibitor RaiA